ncbi:hypothetical protein Dimus_000374 [Dionaea muscipula]
MELRRSRLAMELCPGCVTGSENQEIEVRIEREKREHIPWSSPSMAEDDGSVPVLAGDGDGARELSVVWSGLQMKIEEENSEPRSENLEREEENTYPGRRHRRRWSGGNGGTTSSPLFFVVAGGLVEELELGELSMEMADGR